MAGLDLRKLLFDSILVRKRGDSYNPMSIEEFVGLPVDERIALLMQRKIRFFDGETEVATYDAVKSLDDARR
ncbi:MAG TPA: hypothetical protein VKA74_10215 [Myxococcota bacterium]|nr:hypothetical protein [Myxococcota bacterium]